MDTEGRMSFLEQKRTFVYYKKDVKINGGRWRMDLRVMNDFFGKSTG